MRTIEAIAQVLKAEGLEYLSAFPTTPLIEACAIAGIRPIVCRQERVGATIADGYSRVTNGEPPGVFAMQYGPGAENAYPGVTTAFSDSTPVLYLPMGHPEDRLGVFPLFSAVSGYRPVTKRVERLTSASRTRDVMRRAIAALRQGRPGPVMVEIPWDVADHELNPPTLSGQIVKRTASEGDPRDVAAAARALCAASSPVVQAGSGVLYAGATDELIELAELLGLPVLSTLVGKSSFPENHPLSLGCGTHVMPRPVDHFVRRADLILGIGTSLTRHGMSMPIPPGKVLIQATNDPVDLHKDYEIAYPIVGDAKLILRQLIDACKEIVGARGRPNPAVADEIASVRQQWLAEWMPTLNSDDRPINPYRVIWDFMKVVDPSDAIVTHDSGNPRSQLIPFYRSAGPRSYLGWGKSHALGAGLGLIMGAKLARPEKVCVNFMGDAAFGMVGLDIETAVRNQIAILTVVLNNRGMASEPRGMPHADALYQTSSLGGNYVDVARGLGAYAERIEEPSQIVDAFKRARRITTDEGRPVLLEVITSRETAASEASTNCAPVRSSIAHR